MLSCIIWNCMLIFCDGLLSKNFILIIFTVFPFILSFAIFFPVHCNYNYPPLWKIQVFFDIYSSFIKFENTIYIMEHYWMMLLQDLMPWSWVTCKVVANFDSTPLYRQLGLHFSFISSVRVHLLLFMNIAFIVFLNSCH